MTHPHPGLGTPAKLATGALRIVALGGLGEIGRNMTVFEMTDYAIRYSPAVVQFVGKALFPLNLSVFPIIQDTSMVYGVCAITLIVFALTLSKRKRYNYIFFGSLWMISFLLLRS